MTRKNTFLEGLSWFKFNNLGLALGTNLKFYASVTKGLKLKVINFGMLDPTSVEVIGEKGFKYFEGVKDFMKQQRDKICDKKNIC